MPIIERWDEPGGIHHVVNRGRCFEPIFLDDLDRAMFIVALVEVVRRGLLRVLAFALMGNHYHLVVTSDEGTLSEGMQLLGTLYFQGFNRRHERDGQVCKSRFVNVRVWSPAQLRATIAYVHDNPVKAGLAPRVDLARFTSYAPLAGLEERPDWLEDLAVPLTRSPAEELELRARELPRAVAALLAEHTHVGDEPATDEQVIRRARGLNRALHAHHLAAAWAREHGVSLPDIAGADLRSVERDARNALILSLREAGVSPGVIAFVLEMRASSVRTIHQRMRAGGTNLDPA